LENVVLTIHLILALLLIGVVLLQRSEGGGLGMGGGGGGGTMSARGSATPLTKLTWIFAVCFIITSVTLTILATRSNQDGSVVDDLAAETPAADTGTDTQTDTPATGGGLAGTDLTLPGATTGDAPATPPRADEPAAPATNP
jgi:preprotein translocase subunit SecG